MPQAITYHCATCGEVVFKGSMFWYGPGGMKQDIKGKYLAGAGQCGGCGKNFCAEHLENGLCPDCREDDEEYFPF